MRCDVVSMLRSYRKKGFEIVPYRSRNMRAHQSSAVVSSGREGLCVDDKAARPEEATALSHDENRALLGTLADLLSGGRRADLIH